MNARRIEADLGRIGEPITLLVWCKLRNFPSCPFRQRAGTALKYFKVFLKLFSVRLEFNRKLIFR